MSQDDPPPTRLSRRECVAGGVAAVTAAVAGCTEGTVNWLADRVLEEVNVLNQTENSINGTVSVVDPDGETRLNEEFTAVGGDDTDENHVYGDVWTESGSYEVSVTLEEPLDGVESVSGTVSVADTDDEMLFVVLGPADSDEAVSLRVDDDLTDVVSEDE